MITVKNISPIENFIFMQMKDNGKLLCDASAEIEGDTAELIDIKEYEKGFSYDMGKAVLNAIDVKGIKKVVCNNKNLHEILIKLRFSCENCAYLLSLDEYFMSNCEKL